MRLIIAGGRDFKDMPLLRKKMRSILDGKKVDVVLSGLAAGADSLGMCWANEFNIPIEEYPAQWDKFGKRAGYLRNELMAVNATHLIAFYDGESRGTRHMIDLARNEGLDVRIVRY